MQKKKRFAKIILQWNLVSMKFVKSMDYFYTQGWPARNLIFKKYMLSKFILLINLKHFSSNKFLKEGRVLNLQVKCTSKTLTFWKSNFRPAILVYKSNPWFSPYRPCRRLWGRPERRPWQRRPSGLAVSSFSPASPGLSVGTGSFGDRGPFCVSAKIWKMESGLAEGRFKHFHICSGPSPKLYEPLKPKWKGLQIL